MILSIIAHQKNKDGCWAARDLETCMIRDDKTSEELGRIESFKV